MLFYYEWRKSVVQGLLKDSIILEENEWIQFIEFADIHGEKYRVNLCKYQLGLLLSPLITLMIDDYDVKMINPMYGQIKDKTSIPVIIHRICTDGIEFSDGTLMQTFHPRGCSEVHFADWPALSLYNINLLNGDKISVYDLKFSMFMEQMIQPVDNMGFNLVAIDGSKYFVPCYGCNNGYYSMDITLIIGKQGGTGIILGLTNCQKIFDADYNVFEQEKWIK